MIRGRWSLVASVVALAAAVGTAEAVVSNSTQTGVIGPKNMIQPTGRLLAPAGKVVGLGNDPQGGALSPNGKFLWTLSSGIARNDIRIVKVGVERGHGTAKVIQSIVMPGLNGEMAFAPNGKTAYVSGIPASTLVDNKVPASVPGQGGDVIAVFKVNPKTGHATRDGVISVPPPSTAPAEQAFPPTTTKISWPLGLAVSPNGKTLLAALNLADMAAVINTANRAVRYVPVGHYPYGAAITSNGRFGLVTSETEATVSVINLKTATVTKTLQIGPHLADSSAIAVDPKAPLAFVTNSNEDVISVINTARLRVQGLLSLMHSTGNGTTPTSVTVTRDGCDLLSADSGEDATAVFALSRAKQCNPGAKGKRAAKVLQLVGRIPTASYPTFAAGSSAHGLLMWVAANGIGVGPNLNGPNPLSPFNGSNDVSLHFQYLPAIARGDAGVLPFPSDKQIRAMTPVADRELIPTNEQSAPKGTPIRDGGPIKHVFFIIKENRTYDQVFGDIKRGDGDPKLTLFGQNITPNAHALVTRFPLLDHVYADSQISIEGHYWTDSGSVPPYVIKNWPSTSGGSGYGQRGRPVDFGLTEASAPATGSIFQRALAQKISFYNYGEVIGAMLAPAVFADKDRTPAEQTQNNQVLAGSDVQLFGGGPAYPGGPKLPACYDSDLSIFSPLFQPSTHLVFDSSLPPGAPANSDSRYTCWLNRFTQQLAHNVVPAINYMVLPLDHTQGVTPGDRTPYADVADNDLALGQIVDQISHSRIWGSSLILVLEDDAQNGSDHVDAHRIPVMVISPYAEKGAVIHNRYDELSFLRTLEIIVGMKPTNLDETLAVPLYDAFSAKPSNSAPYTAITPNVNLLATNPNTAADRAATAGLNFNVADQVPEQQFDAMLWHSVHGFNSPAPPPGPDASPSVPANDDSMLYSQNLTQMVGNWLQASQRAKRG
jgi:DNA-binding beta-propeller fold protein YncE